LYGNKREVLFRRCLFEQNNKKLLRSKRKKLKQNQVDLEKGSNSSSPNSQSHTTQAEKWLITKIMREEEFLLLQEEH